LKAFCESGDHHFWPDTLSLLDEALFARAVMSHRRTTDIYLLGLAQKNGGHLATFDRSIPVQAVIGRRRDLLEVIAPAEVE
jgi:predicted nucleic acid-binding protein